LLCSHSTADFRNAFLKTIRQIIRESVRNMSIPATKPLFGNGCNSSNSGESGSEKGMKPTILPSSGPGAHNSHTLGKPKKPPKPGKHFLSSFKLVLIFFI